MGVTGARGYSDDEIEIIAKLLREGLSGSELAARFGAMTGRNVSRNAIIGVVHRNRKLKRIGFSHAGPSIQGPRRSPKATKAEQRRARLAPKAKAQPQPLHAKTPDTFGFLPARAFVQNVVAEGEFDREASRAYPPPAPHVPRSPASRAAQDFPPEEYDRQSRRIELTELKSGDCRWPVNDAAPREIHLFCGHPVDAGSSYCLHHRLRATGDAWGRGNYRLVAWPTARLSAA